LIVTPKAEAREVAAEGENLPIVQDLAIKEATMGIPKQVFTTSEEPFS